MQSTLFNAICENSKAQAANYPFCTIEPNVGIVAVPDSRLQVCSHRRLHSLGWHADLTPSLTWSNISHLALPTLVQDSAPADADMQSCAGALS